ncbi:hypothetical protein V1478_014116, partial [Vespula squamosa]
CSLSETGRTSLNQRSNSRLTAYISRWQGFNNFHWEEPSSYLYEGHRMQYVTRTPYGEIEIVQRMRLTFTFSAVKTLQIRQVGTIGGTLAVTSNTNTNTNTNSNSNSNSKSNSNSNKKRTGLVAYDLETYSGYASKPRAIRHDEFLNLSTLVEL